MNDKKEMTACNTSVGADDRQSLHVTNYSNHIQADCEYH